MQTTIQQFFKPSQSISASTSKQFKPKKSVGNTNSSNSSTNEQTSNKKKRALETNCPISSPNKKAKYNEESSSQLIIDAGQKSTATCKECGMLYSLGSKIEQANHLAYHTAKLSLPRIKVPKSDASSILFQHPSESGTQIIYMTETDAMKRPNVKQLLDLVDEQLQFSAESEPHKEKGYVYIYLSDGIGVGVARAEQIQFAHRLKADTTSSLPVPTSSSSTEFSMTNNAESSYISCSREREAAEIGISRLWVASEFRKKGIATTILDVIRSNFVLGCIIQKDQLAMTQPTRDGRSFAHHYFGTPSFLVYEPNENVEDPTEG